MPIKDMQKRAREVGRIRIGAKASHATKKNQDGSPVTYPVKLDTFRFTSQDKAAIEVIAMLYGGEVKLWQEGQWEVITTSAEINIIVPVPCQFSQWYEKWAGGKCLLRCDGETESKGQDPRPCVCDAEGVEDKHRCNPVSRLGVFMPEVPNPGIWRIESNGWNAAVDLSSSIQLLQSVVPPGTMLRATLALEKREKKVDKEGGGTTTQKYNVPVIRIPVTLNQLEAVSGGKKFLSLEMAEEAEDDETPMLPESTTHPAVAAQAPLEKAAVQQTDVFKASDYFASLDMTPAEIDDFKATCGDSWVAQAIEEQGKKVAAKDVLIKRAKERFKK
jgi:hypothetical protein